MICYFGCSTACMVVLASAGCWCRRKHTFAYLPCTGELKDSAWLAAAVAAIALLCVVFL